MQADVFVKALQDELAVNFYCGVPDSQLKALCNFLLCTYGVGARHIIAANEGNCTAIAAGYYLATKSIPVVYMQNSGEGNVINPFASLLHTKVYGIPCLFVVGWRGEPGVHDELQHIFQGKITKELLTLLEIDDFVLEQTTTLQDLRLALQDMKEKLYQGRSTAILVRKGALSYEKSNSVLQKNQLLRETALKKIIEYSGDGVLVSTTGKTSRELFELRENAGQGHERDFLTVGSMGHASSIALGIALQRPQKKIWCIDGDGAALMHMGAMAVIGSQAPQNFVHILINNGAHESVGGMPTVADKIDFLEIAKGCGYKKTQRVFSIKDLEEALAKAVESRELYFIEIQTRIGSRSDLGRPTLSPHENKRAFMQYVMKK